MSLKELFQQKVPETFAFVRENYGFEFENISDSIFLRKSRAFLLVTAKVDGFYSQKQRFLYKLTG
jgi:hypothetical protein